jgi:hypothetical protein
LYIAFQDNATAVQDVHLQPAGLHMANHERELGTVDAEDGTDMVLCNVGQVVCIAFS